MISHLYRFRPLDRLIDCGELDRQEIYFAKPEQLNDPMEGFRDIYWKGDTIVWKNLFRHYIFCLERAYCLLAISQPDQVFGWEEIPVLSFNSGTATPFQQKIIDHVVSNFLSNEAVQCDIRLLAARKLPIRRNELSAYLRAIHPFALSIIFEAHVRFGLQPAKELSPNFGEQIQRGLEQGRTVIEQFSLLQDATDDPEFAMDAFFDSHLRMLSQLNLIHFYNGVIDQNSPNKNFVLLNFPEEYVTKIETLVFPDWYPACFMLECRDASVWGSYGDRHRAVCLKFKVRESNGRPAIRLNRISGFAGDSLVRGTVDQEFHEIMYESQHLPIDFFHYLRFPIPTLTAHWYTDQVGNRSICGDGVFNKIDEWRADYWRGFFHAVTRKLNDWRYELEYRLILSSEVLDFSNRENRIAYYEFDDLDGIIFGIKTPIKRKLEIFKIIEKKCRAAKRENFKFYQAYYSRKSGKIEYAEMSLLRFIST